MPRFILVQTVKELPLNNVTTRLINIDCIRDVVQEWADPDPDYAAGKFISLIAETDTDDPLPVVHITLEYSLNAFPILDPGKTYNDSRIPQLPIVRPSEIWAPGLLRDFTEILQSGDSVVVFNGNLAFERWKFQIGHPWPLSLPAAYEVLPGATVITIPYNVVPKSEAVLLNDVELPHDSDTDERSYGVVYTADAMIITMNEPVKVEDKFIIKFARKLDGCGGGGSSNYELAVEHGFIGTPEEWLATLVGPPGVSGGSYTHIQAIPADTWVCLHNLGYNPAVTVIDSADDQVFGNIQYAGLDTVIITFNGEFSGKAYFS